MEALAAAKAPLPPLPKIRIGHGPAYPDFSYYDPQEDIIYLLWSDAHNRFALFHELGHVFDRKLLTPELRRRAARIVGHSGLRWFWGNWNPLSHLKQPNEENFADAYAECCLGYKGRMHSRLRRFLEEVVHDRYP